MIAKKKKKRLARPRKQVRFCVKAEIRERTGVLR